MIEKDKIDQNRRRFLIKGEGGVSKEGRLRCNCVLTKSNVSKFKMKLFEEGLP